MRTIITAIVVGLAIAAACLGAVSDILGRSDSTQDPTLARPESRTNTERAVTPVPHGPGSHKDPSAEAIGVALNPNLIAGRHTVVCTTDLNLFHEHDAAVDIWNSRLAGLNVGTTAGPLRLHTSGGAAPACPA